jgi:hypothetical protein
MMLWVLVLVCPVCGGMSGSLCDWLAGAAHACDQQLQQAWLQFDSSVCYPLMQYFWWVSQPKVSVVLV